MELIAKNRVRDQYSFANINLLGSCNTNCYFCLGKDIQHELWGKNQLAVHFNEWKNFEHFLDMCRREGVQKLYLTGQTADGLQYKYLQEIVDYLQGQEFLVGVRTNGYLAQAKMPIIQQMKGGIGYSIHTLKPDVNWQVMGRRDLPDWDWIIPQSGPNVRVSIVLNRYNIGEFHQLCWYISQFSNVRYIQVRRICSDTRLQVIEEDIRVYEEFYQKFRKVYPQYGEFHLAQQHRLYGKEVDFWRTVETNVNSLNYFTDGTCSDEYFIVEGYLKNMEPSCCSNKIPIS